MSDEATFAPPPFDAEKAMVQLRRALRDLKLTERGHRHEWKANTVVEATVDGGHIQAQLARRPLRAPEWDRFTLASHADLRRFTDEVRRRLSRWADDER